jgi:hypothetical protein
LCVSFNEYQTGFFNFFSKDFIKNKYKKNPQ